MNDLSILAEEMNRKIVKLKLGQQEIQKKRRELCPDSYKAQELSRTFNILDGMIQAYEDVEGTITTEYMS